MLEIKPIRLVRASGEVLSQLKEAILRGHLKAGDKLPSERELTGDFRVSRSVIREAIRVLEATRFVTIKQGHAGGAYVNEMNFENLSCGFLDLYLANRLTIPELNQVRLHMEPEVARLAALRVNVAFRMRLQNALQGERVLFKSNEDRMKGLTDVHFILAEMCGNYLFEAIVNALINLTRRIVETVKPEDHNALHPVGEHDTIAQAVMKGDSEGAKAAMTKHLLKFSKSLMAMDKVYRGLSIS
jgi:GntR family transcriptional regulator, transcriptional repressor for pyruvate dehydrogenase complex